MREVLFRGFHSDENGNQKVFIDGKWIKGCWYTGGLWHTQKTTYCFKEDYKRNPDNDEYYILWGLPNNHYKTNVIPSTVGQFIGLTDKNGTKIFEGGICSYNDYVGVVEFDEEECMFTFTYDGNIITDFSCLWGKELEIIGNIFENPELLN